jgi:hypothetical protein
MSSLTGKATKGAAPHSKPESDFVSEAAADPRASPPSIAAAALKRGWDRDRGTNASYSPAHLKSLYRQTAWPLSDTHTLFFFIYVSESVPSPSFPLPGKPWSPVAFENFKFSVNHQSLGNVQYCLGSNSTDYQYY